MAEFCIDCWNELNDSEEPAHHFVVSREEELCEGCGQMKHIVVRKRNFYWLWRLLRIRL